MELTNNIEFDILSDRNTRTKVELHYVLHLIFIRHVLYLQLCPVKVLLFYLVPKCHGKPGVVLYLCSCSTRSIEVVSWEVYQTSFVVYDRAYLSVLRSY